MLRWFRCLGMIKRYSRRRLDGPYQSLRLVLRMTFCFQERAFRDWSNTSKDAYRSRLCLSSSWPCCKRRASLLLFCRWCHQGEELLHLYRHPNSLISYVNTVATGTKFIEDTLSDFGVSGRYNHIRLLDSFLFGRHCSNKIIVGEKTNQI